MSNDASSPGGVGGPPAQTSSHRGWHHRGYLPHFDAPGMWQSITYRLADALPIAVVRKLAEELGIADARAGRPRPQGKAFTDDDPDDERRRAYRKKVEAWLDAGQGACHLRDPSIAEIVQHNLLHHAGERYHLGAWVVMPNHVHVLIRIQESWPLDRVVHGWKSFTAKRIITALALRPPLWQGEYWDRYIRDEAHWLRAKQYIEENPVAARLVKKPQEWKWSSASFAESSTSA
ncbi:MAG: transposase [Planctomycetes bacterium]|nr:transposase [Planctomycetota bacterium]